MKRKRKESCPSPILDESPKRTKVQAQRKFAQNSGVNSSMITPIRDLEAEDLPHTSVLPEPVELLPMKRPNTEDFLTFLCFRGTPILPPSLQFFNTASIVADGQVHEIKGDCPKNGPIDITKCAGSSSEKPFIAFGVRKRADPIVISRQMERKRRHALAIQALRRKYQEQKMAKIRALTISKLSEKTTNKTLVKTNTIQKTETVTKKTNTMHKTKVIATKHVKVTTQTLKTKVKPKMCLRSFGGKFVQKELPFRPRRPLLEADTIKKSVVRTSRNSNKEEVKSSGKLNINKPQKTLKRLVDLNQPIKVLGKPRVTRSGSLTTVVRKPTTVAAKSFKMPQIKRRILLPATIVATIVKPKLRSTTMKKTVISRRKEQQRLRATISKNSRQEKLSEESNMKESPAKHPIDSAKKDAPKKATQEKPSLKKPTPEEATKEVSPPESQKSAEDVSRRVTRKDSSVSSKHTQEGKKEITKNLEVKKEVKIADTGSKKVVKKNVNVKKEFNLKTSTKDIKKNTDLQKTSDTVLEKHDSGQRITRDVKTVETTVKKIVTRKSEEVKLNDKTADKSASKEKKSNNPKLRSTKDETLSTEIPRKAARRLSKSTDETSKKTEKPTEIPMKVLRTSSAKSIAVDKETTAHNNPLKVTRQASTFKEPANSKSESSKASHAAEKTSKEKDKKKALVSKNNPKEEDSPEKTSQKNMDEEATRRVTRDSASKRVSPIKSPIEELKKSKEILWTKKTEQEFSKKIDELINSKLRESNERSSAKKESFESTKPVRKENPSSKKQSCESEKHVRKEDSSKKEPGHQGNSLSEEESCEPEKLVHKENPLSKKEPDHKLNPLSKKNPSLEEEKCELEKRAHEENRLSKKEPGRKENPLSKKEPGHKENRLLPGNSSESTTLVHEGNPSLEKQSCESEDLVCKENPLSKKESIRKGNPLKGESCEPGEAVRKESPSSKKQTWESKELVHKENPSAKKEPGYKENTFSDEESCKSEKLLCKENPSSKKQSRHGEDPLLKAESSTSEKLHCKENPSSKTESSHEEDILLREESSKSEILLCKENPSWKKESSREEDPLLKQESPKSDQLLCKENPLQKIESIHEEDPLLEKESSKSEKLLCKETASIKNESGHKGNPFSKEGSCESEKRVHKENPSSKKDSGHKGNAFSKEESCESEKIVHKDNPSSKKDSGHKGIPFSKEESCELEKIAHKENPSSKKDSGHNGNPFSKEESCESEKIVHKETPSPKKEICESEKLVCKENPSSKKYSCELTKSEPKENPSSKMNYFELSNPVHKENPSSKKESYLIKPVHKGNPSSKNESYGTTKTDLKENPASNEDSCESAQHVHKQNPSSKNKCEFVKSVHNEDANIATSREASNIKTIEESLLEKAEKKELSKKIEKEAMFKNSPAEETPSTIEKEENVTFTIEDSLSKKHGKGGLLIKKSLKQEISLKKTSKELAALKRDENPKRKSATKRDEPEKVTPAISARPSRKTKEAAAIYMEILSHKLVNESTIDDDNVSIDSFPELPNVKRTEQREIELKAQAKTSKDEVKPGRCSPEETAEDKKLLKKVKITKEGATTVTNLSDNDEAMEPEKMAHMDYEAPESSKTKDSPTKSGQAPCTNVSDKLKSPVSDRSSSKAKQKNSFEESNPSLKPNPAPAKRKPNPMTVASDDDSDNEVLLAKIRKSEAQKNSQQQSSSTRKTQPEEESRPSAPVEETTATRRQTRRCAQIVKETDSDSSDESFHIDVRVPRKRKNTRSRNRAAVAPSVSVLEKNVDIILEAARVLEAEKSLPVEIGKAAFTEPVSETDKIPNPKVPEKVKLEPGRIESDASTTSDINLKSLQVKQRNKKLSKTKSSKSSAKSAANFSDSDEEPLAKLTTKNVRPAANDADDHKKKPEKQAKAPPKKTTERVPAEVPVIEPKPKRECTKRPSNYLPMLSSSDEDDDPYFHGFNTSKEELNKPKAFVQALAPSLDLLSKDIGRKGKVNMSNEEIERWLKDSALAGSSVAKENDAMLKFGEKIPTEIPKPELVLPPDLPDRKPLEPQELKVTVVEPLPGCSKEKQLEEKPKSEIKSPIADRKWIFKKDKKESTPNKDAFSPENECSVYAFGEDNEDVVSTPFRRPSRRPSSTATSRSEDELLKIDESSKPGQFRKPNPSDTEDSRCFNIPQNPTKLTKSAMVPPSSYHSKRQTKTNPDRFPEPFDDYKYKIPSSPSASSGSSANLYKKGAQKQKGKIWESINPVYVSDFPKPTDPAKLVEAPVFHPTEQEFQDPLEYIERIRHKAEQFGICKVVPPTGFKPECKVSDDMRFTAYNQYVHKMLHRWGPNFKEFIAIKKYLATQSIFLKTPPLIGGMEIDLPRLYQTVQSLGGLKEVIEKKKWSKVSDHMKIPKSAQDRVTKLDDIYCKYLLPYDTLSPAEREKLFDEVETYWAKRESKNLQERTDSKPGSKDELSEQDFDSDDNETEECTIKGKNMALNAFYRIARNTMSMYFKVAEPTALEVEQEFWRYVTQKQNHICVHSASIDCSTWGYGFAVSKNSPFARHPWNLKVLSNNNGSVLRSLGPVMGVTIPTLHVGMVFSACCWYRDPHGLPWVEYLHTGGNKIWYGIPSSSCEVFHAAMQKLVPNYCRDKQLWLPSDTAMIPPGMLMDHNVSLCRTIQEPGQFIIVFPKVFTSSISTGYVVSESVYFAPLHWLKTAQNLFNDLKTSCEPSMFSLDKLLISISNDNRSSVEVLRVILPFIEKLCREEVDNRLRLRNFGKVEEEKVSTAEPPAKKKKVQSVDGDFECEICRTNLFVSMVIDTQDDLIYCLEDALKLVAKNGKTLERLKLRFSLDEAELNNIPKKIISAIETKLQKKMPGKYSGLPTLLK